MSESHFAGHRNLIIGRDGPAVRTVYAHSFPHRALEGPLVAVVLGNATGGSVGYIFLDPVAARRLADQLLVASETADADYVTHWTKVANER